MANYSFKKIEQLEDGQKKINLMGVVSSFRPPSKSRGNDYSCSMSLVDESGQSVRCVLFNPNEDGLPQNCSSGDVVCLHRVNVSEFNDRLQIQGARFSTWMLFRLDGIGTIPITSPSTDSYTLTQADKSRVKQLKRWSLQNYANAASGISSALTPMTITPSSVVPSSAATKTRSTTGICAAASTSTLTSGSTPSTSTNASQKSRVFEPRSKRFSGANLETLSKLTPNPSKRVGVCGIVKYFKAPMASKGKDCYTAVGIIDETSPQRSLECVIFNPCKEKLPLVQSVGEVILIKGITIGNYKNALTGSGHEHTIIGIFSADPSTKPPTRIGTWYSLRPNEVSRIISLKQWAVSQRDFYLNTKFEEVNKLHYFNTVCRIASIARDDQSRIRALSVYDGTTLKLCSSEQLLVSLSSKHHLKIDIDRNAHKYEGLIHDVEVNEMKKNVKVGDTVELVNVLCISEPDRGNAHDPNNTSQIKLKLCVQKGSIRVLSKDSPSVQQFLNNMPRPCGPFPEQRSLSNVPRAIGTVLGQQTKQTATLKQIQDAPIDSKFCCKVKVLNVEPGPLEDICQLRCSHCMTRYKIPKDLKDTEFKDRSLRAAGDPCIYCNDSAENVSTLKYMYMFMLRVKDSTGELTVLVLKEQGDILLQNLPPNNLYVDSGLRQKLLDVFYRLTGGNDPFYPIPCDPKFSYPRPVFNCCILKYMSQTKDHYYSLIDTVLN